MLNRKSYIVIKLVGETCTHDSLYTLFYLEEGGPEVQCWAAYLACKYRKLCTEKTTICRNLCGHMLLSAWLVTQWSHRSNALQHLLAHHELHNTEFPSWSPLSLLNLDRHLLAHRSRSINVSTAEVQLASWCKVPCGKMGIPQTHISLSS